jgi:hypothetical protein
VIILSFSVSKSGERDEVSDHFRNGSHHVHGDRSQLDKAREFIAEEVDRAPCGSLVSVTVSGHHDEFQRSLSLNISAAPPPVPTDPAPAEGPTV